MNGRGLVKLKFSHSAIVSRGEGHRGAVIPGEGDRRDPGAVLDQVEVEAVEAVRGRGLGVEGKVA